MKLVSLGLLCATLVFAGATFGHDDNFGYGMCIRKGFSPSSWDPNGSRSYGDGINAGYAPSSCATGG